jgi:hypothetical protein
LRKIYNKLLICIVYVLAISARPVRAEVTLSEIGKGVLFVGFAEALFAINAAVASNDPRGYGTATGLLFFPLGLASDGYENETGRWVGFALAESIALYNAVGINRDRMSRAAIFSNNMIAWNIYAGVLGATYLITNRSGPSSESVSLNLYPAEDGAGFIFRYRF